MTLPDLTSSIALLGFLPITLLVMLFYRSTNAALALAFAGLMFLPSGPSFDLPAVPSLHKNNLPYIYLLIATILFLPERFKRLKLGSGPDILVMVLLLGGVGTALLNQDPLMWGIRVGNRMSPYDIFTLSSGVLLTIWVPVAVGRMYIRSSEDLERLLKAFVIGALVYSVFCWLEIRLSPRFHKWVYGFHPIDFRFSVRWGGYRPTVFMANGMALGVFIAAAAVAAGALYRAKAGSRNLTSRAGSYLLVLLVMVKSTAAVLYGFVFAPMMFLMTGRRQRLVVTLALAAVVSYPLMRQFQIFPTDTLVSVAELVSVNRAQSLDFRFENEDRLLTHALERPVFGWGLFGRNRVYDRWTGRDQTVTDGYWIILMGSRGILGWAAIFGIALWPVFYTLRNLDKVAEPRDRYLLVGTATVVVIHVLDWLPNGLFTNFGFFLAGGLWAAAHQIVAGSKDVRVAATPRVRGPRILGAPAPAPLVAEEPAASASVSDVIRQPTRTSS